MADWSSLLGSLNAAAVAAFGREVLYSPQDGPPFTLPAIFEATREAEENTLGVYAAVFVRAADLSVVPQRGDSLTVDDVVYMVYDIQVDQGGGLVLRLRQS